MPQAPYLERHNIMAPAEDLVAVTPDDANNLPGGECRGLLVGVAGNASLVTARGNTVSGVPLQAGFNPIRCVRVRATGTAATNIWAIY